MATFCKRAVVEFVLKRPRALLFNPWERQASTAPKEWEKNGESERTAIKQLDTERTCHAGKSLYEEEVEEKEGFEDGNTQLTTK